MPIVEILGQNKRAKFPDNISRESIRDFLRQKFAQEASQVTPPSLEPRSSIKAYNPTLSEKASNVIASALYDNGLISDRYRAQNIGDNLTALSEFLPGAGDIIDAEQFGRSAAQGDAGGMAMSALGVIPVLGDAAQGLVKGFKRTTGDSLVDSKVKDIVMMSPDKYLEESFRVTDGALGGDFQGWMSSNAVSREVMEGYAEAMKKGDEFPLPYIDYLDGSQDGRNRALAAKKAGIEEIPVGIIPDISDQEKIKIIREEMKSATGLKKYRLEQQLGALKEVRPITEEVLPKGKIGADKLRSIKKIDSKATTEKVDEGIKVTYRKEYVPKRVKPDNKYLFDFDPDALEVTEKQFKNVTDYKGDANKPITVTKKDGNFYILDGHHRAKLAKDQGRDVRAVVLPEKDFEALKKKGIHQADMRKEWIATGGYK